MPRGRQAARQRDTQARGRAGELLVADDLDGIAPRESARNRARDKKIRGPKVISVNPGLKKLAQHIADQRTGLKKKKKVR